MTLASGSLAGETMTLASGSLAGETMFPPRSPFFTLRGLGGVQPSRPSESAFGHGNGVEQQKS